MRHPHRRALEPLRALIAWLGFLMAIDDAGVARVAGLATAAEILLELARLLEAEVALQRGLVQRVMPDEEVGGGRGHRAAHRRRPGRRRAPRAPVQQALRLVAPQFAFSSRPSASSSPPTPAVLTTAKASPPSSRSAPRSSPAPGSTGACARPFFSSSPRRRGSTPAAHESTAANPNLFAALRAAPSPTSTRSRSAPTAG
ncbi:MAG: hypothetical protein U1F21_03485 [Sphaerotilus natans]